MKLTYAQRQRLPDSDFALPGRRYPIENKAHARNALARASQHASPAEREIICARVHAKYPSIAEGGECPIHHVRHMTPSEYAMRRANR